jgi:hypothetical protein
MTLTSVLHLTKRKIKGYQNFEKVLKQRKCIFKNYSYITIIFWK